ncbi:MAG: hypothetical protein HRU19_11295 [Pseudobacteriovorax sp.]|nr:hypothetical protein [Pseudobacteriovorax sp.]
MDFIKNLAIPVILTCGFVGCGVSSESEDSSLNSVENLIVDGIFSPKYVFDEAHKNEYRWTTTSQNNIGLPIFPLERNFGAGGLLPGSSPNSFQAPYGAVNMFVGDPSFDIGLPDPKLPGFQIQHSNPGSIQQGKDSMVPQGSQMKITGIGGQYFQFEYRQQILNKEELDELRAAGITRLNISATLKAKHTSATVNEPKYTFLRITCAHENPFINLGFKVIAETIRSDSSTDLTLSTGATNINIDDCLVPSFGGGPLGATTINIRFKIKSREAILYDFVPILSVIR